MSLYDEAPAPAGEGELVVPDYSAPAATSNGPTAMGSDGTMLTGGGAASGIQEGLVCATRSAAFVLRHSF